MTFYGAQDQCRKYGGYLIHINNIREQVFIEDFLLQEMQLDGKCNCFGSQQFAISGCFYLSGLSKISQMAVKTIRWRHTLSFSVPPLPLSFLLSL